MEAIVLTHPARLFTPPARFAMLSASRLRVGRNLFRLRRDFCASGDTCCAFGMIVMPLVRSLHFQRSFHADPGWVEHVETCIANKFRNRKRKKETKSKTILQFRNLARSLFWNWSVMRMSYFVFLLHCTRCAPGNLYCQWKTHSKEPKGSSRILYWWMECAL